MSKTLFLMNTIKPQGNQRRTRKCIRHTLIVVPCAQHKLPCDKLPKAVTSYLVTRKLPKDRMPIIINGEVVPDNDPRAIERRAAAAKGSGGGGSAPRPSAPGANVHGGQSRPMPAAAAGGSPLDALANAIGVQGQTVQIPAVMSIPARDVPMIMMIILAVLTLVAGWKVLAVAAALHVFSGLSDGAARGGGGGGGARPSAPGGRPGGPGGRPGGANVHGLSG